MTGASKILTVSYGTFSCTLEGFDDPFGTMKAIAEYFRDLAAEDRYFGAEPPTPDAAMLHRIAEREIQRRVEAKIQENGVLLRAADQAEAAPAEPAPQPALAPAVLDAPAPSAESVADRLSRLRSEVAQQSAVTAPVVSFAMPEEDDGYDLPDVVEVPPEIAAAMVEDVVEAGPPVADAVEQPEPSLADIDTPFPEEMGDATEPALPEDAALADAETVDAPLPATPVDTDALLAGLMADLAIQPKPVAEAAPEKATLPAPQVDVAQPDLTSEDETAFAANADEAPVADEVLVDAAIDAVEATVEATAADTAEDTGPFAEGTAEPEAPAAVNDDHAPQAADAEPFDIAAFAQSVEDTPPQPAAMDDASPEDDAAEPAQSLFAPIDDADDTEGTPADTAESGEAPALRPEAAERLQRARARVVRIRRVEAPVADLPAPAEAEPADAAPAAAEQPLTAQAEADLEAELAALRDDADSATTAPEPADADTDTPPAADGRRVFEGEAADAALTRLMAQADEHLEGQENKRRLSAIAHLKAAVAATVADRKVTGGEATEQPSRLARYRDDLAMVVRNKLGGAPAAAAPQGERPAPLVLVSEQRIDRPRPVAVPAPAPAPVAPPATVRPRRVAAATGLALADDDLDDDDALDTAPAADSGGFAAFAERLGAETLTEQLEAAAAYMACVERRDQFTRPQLMRLAQVASPDGEIGREDGLRSFGTLLRTGRLQKVRRGQFALSEASAYLAEGRRIAG